MYWPRLATALLIAAHVWGEPACGQPSVVWASPPASDAGLPDAAAWADVSTCTIRLDIKRRGLVMSDPGYRCTLIVHEWGHLTGHGHSADPTNVMYFAPWDYWRCYPPNMRLL